MCRGGFFSLALVGMIVAAGARAGGLADKASRFPLLGAGGRDGGVAAAAAERGIVRLPREKQGDGIDVWVTEEGQFTIQRTSDAAWLLFPDPASTYLSLSVDGTTGANSPYLGGLEVASQVEGTWVYAPVNGVRLTQELSFDGEALKCRLTVENLGAVAKTVGARYLLDTQVDDNDGAPLYAAGQHYTHEVEFQPPGFTEWRSWRRPDDQSVLGVGALERGVTKRVVFASWPYAYEAIYDYEVDPDFPFYTPGFTESPESDSCVLVYLDFGSVPAGATVTGSTWYGSGPPSAGSDVRERVCEAMRRFAQSVREYQAGCIDVMSWGTVDFARSVAEETDLKTTALGFAADLVSSGIPSKIIGKMARNSAGKAAWWIRTKMVPQIRDAVIMSSAFFLANHVEDWTNADGGIDPAWTDDGIASYIEQYFSDPTRLGADMVASTDLAEWFCDRLPDTLDEAQAERVIAEIDATRNRVERLVPQVGRAREEPVYWAIPGVCSFEAFGGLNPVLLGASSYAAESEAWWGGALETVGWVTNIRRVACVTWVAGVGVWVKILGASTVAGVPVTEATYWTGVGVCGAATEANEMLEFGTSGLAFWNHFENTVTLWTDVRLASTFLKVVAEQTLAALAPAQVCSTDMSVGALEVPDAQAGWLEDFVDATARIAVTNNGDSQGVARAALYVYRKGSATYDDLVRGPVFSGDAVTGPHSSSSINFAFEVPTGNLLQAAKYYAQCYVLTSAGVRVRGAFFRACQPSGCFLDDAWKSIAEGRISGGESREFDVAVEAGATSSEFVLGYQGSDMDLHIYDSGGKHVGFNYETGQVDNEIPGASYSGTGSFPESITVPVGADERFRVVVIGVATSGPEDFFVLQETTKEHPATLGVCGSGIALDVNRGETVQFGLTFGETGGQRDLESIGIAVTDLRGPSSTIPAGLVAYDQPPAALPAGTSATVRFTVPIPATATGAYRGSITVTSAAGDRTVPVTLTAAVPPLRGDTNGDGQRNIADAVAILVHLFAHGDIANPCGLVVADANNDGARNIADAVFMLSYLFAKGPAPDSSNLVCDWMVE